MKNNQLINGIRNGSITVGAIKNVRDEYERRQKKIRSFGVSILTNEYQIGIEFCNLLIKHHHRINIPKVSPETPEESMLEVNNPDHCRNKEKK
jgi:hypothetical protein